MNPIIKKLVNEVKFPVRTETKGFNGHSYDALRGSLAPIGARRHLSAHIPVKDTCNYDKCELSDFCANNNTCGLDTCAVEHVVCTHFHAIIFDESDNPNIMDVSGSDVYCTPTHICRENDYCTGEHVCALTHVCMQVNSCEVDYCNADNCIAVDRCGGDNCQEADICLVNNKCNVRDFCGRDDICQTQDVYSSSYSYCPIDCDACQNNDSYHPSSSSSSLCLGADAVDCEADDHCVTWDDDSSTDWCPYDNGSFSSLCVGTNDSVCQTFDDEDWCTWVDADNSMSSFGDYWPGWAIITISWGPNGHDLDICGYWTSKPEEKVGYDHGNGTMETPWQSDWESGDNTGHGGTEVVHVRAWPWVQNCTYKIHFNYYGDENSATDCTVMVQGRDGTVLTKWQQRCACRTKEAAETGDPYCIITFDKRGKPIGLD